MTRNIQFLKGIQNKSPTFLSLESLDAKLLHPIAIKVTKCVLIIARVLLAFLIAMAKYLMEGRISFGSQFDEAVHHVGEGGVRRMRQLGYCTCCNAERKTPGGGDDGKGETDLWGQQ